MFCPYLSSHFDKSQSISVTSHHPPPSPAADGSAWVPAGMAWYHWCITGSETPRCPWCIHGARRLSHLHNAHNGCLDCDGPIFFHSFLARRFAFRTVSSDFKVVQTVKIQGYPTDSPRYPSDVRSFGSCLALSRPSCESPLWRGEGSWSSGAGTLAAWHLPTILSRKQMGSMAKINYITPHMTHMYV
jgi:hypothetical protein